jgi:NAD(P)-dependent dehydrogenase (short-subunit alcohol dehydrogenase family)
MELGNKKILLVGASSDLAGSLNETLYKTDNIVGFHYNTNEKPLLKYDEGEKVKRFQKDINSSLACFQLVDDFVAWAGGIDCLIQMSGNIKKPVDWEELTEKEWSYDLSANLIMPFFLAQRAVLHMKESGGRILMMSTVSASHGGGATSLAYGVAKAGVECVVKGLARECAKYNILVNAIAPGFFLTKFHTEKMKRDQEQLQERAKMIPLKRAGTTEELAGTVMYLLSEGASYITGQVIAVSGGDWL